jgi:hypothetical protein
MGKTQDLFKLVEIMHRCIDTYRKTPTDTDNINLYLSTQNSLKELYESPPKIPLFPEEQEQIENLIVRPIDG